MKKNIPNYTFHVVVEGENFQLSVNEIENEIPYHRGEPTKMKLYFFPKNQSLIQTIMKRFNSNVKLWKALGTEAMAELGYRIKDNKLSFSQTAGCSCGCSPGLVTTKKTGKSWYITYSLKKKIRKVTLV
jgi:hypothetical protein